MFFSTYIYFIYFLNFLSSLQLQTDPASSSIHNITSFYIVIKYLFLETDSCLHKFSYYYLPKIYNASNGIVQICCR